LLAGIPLGIRRLHEKVQIVKRSFRYIVARSRLRRTLLEAQFRAWVRSPPIVDVAKEKPDPKGKAKSGKDKADRAAEKSASELRKLQSRFEAAVLSDPVVLHALCSRVLQSTREELRVAYRQWAVEYARQVMCKSDACLRFAIRPRRRPRCPHLYACVSHNCCVGVGSDATLSTARQASMSCPLRPAWTQASGSVPQLLLHLQVDWLIHRTVVTEALSVPPPHRPNSFP
jgi:hypothetical protein